MPDIARKIIMQASSRSRIDASLRMSPGRIPLTFTA
jgi:hypothetical protein